MLKTTPFEKKQFNPLKIKLYQSGTASLSAAILASIKLKKQSEQEPEVILPAYACPDLISAVIYAGAKPILIDLSKNSTYLSLSQLNKNITKNTVAVIAINFLGIPEQIDQLKQICSDNNIRLIMDNAQWYPLSSNISNWTGDFNIISFGRGKPVNLLNGGAVISQQSSFHNALPKPTLRKEGITNQINNWLKIILYNGLIQPFIYGVFSRLPGLNIGKTIYKPLESISSMNNEQKQLIQSNIQKYENRTLNFWSIHEKLKTISSQFLIDLLPVNSAREDTVLLRYPILITNKSIRNHFYHETRKLGVSTLYGSPLYEIEGLENILDDKISYPNAKNFSAHLVTLPCHDDINEDEINTIISTLKKLLDS